MGLFLTQLACKINSRENVVKELTAIMKDKGFNLDSKQVVSEITGLDNQFDVVEANKGWVQVFCPETPDDSIPQELSKRLNIPVFQFHIHDGDFWMYQLFVSGHLKDKHTPIPDYYDKISDKEMKNCKGNAKTLAEIFKVKASKVEPYLIFWNDNKKQSNSKAFPKDEYRIGEEWAMVDFQKKFGIEYPDFEKPKSIDIIRLAFQPAKAKKILSLFHRLKQK